jgi:hypothetical protein
LQPEELSAGIIMPDMPDMSDPQPEHPLSIIPESQQPPNSDPIAH